MTARAVPRVAVVGRQNVGKSTLVNRLFGRRETIAHDQPGVTRDRVQLEASWRGRRFGLVDTAGYVAGVGGIEALTRGQADRAMEEAQLILLVVDAQTGITEEDAGLARRLRRATVPVLVVTNKVDTAEDEAEVAPFNALGLGEPLPVSGLHGRGAGELLDRVVHLLDEAPDVLEDEEEEPRFAVVGRPNVGKSSLFNRLVGEQRSVVYEEAGTTRDSVDALVEWSDGPVRFVDTAGMRRQVKVQGVEYYSFVRATRAIDRAHVVMLVIDAQEGFTSEDKKIATRVLDAGRALILIANKWDLVEDKTREFRHIDDAAGQFAAALAVRTSAKTGQGVRRLPALLVDLHMRWRTTISTSRVNDILQRAQRELPTKRDTGTLHYATQVATGPPSFVIFGGATAPDPGYRRYLENRFRRECGLQGVPARMIFRPRSRSSRG